MNQALKPALAANLRPQGRQRLACVIEGHEGYGVRRAWLGILTAMAAQGRDVMIFSLSEGGFSLSLRERGFSVEIIQREPLPRVTGSSLEKYIQFSARLAAQYRRVAPLSTALKQAQISAILMRSPTDVFIAGLAARKLGVPAYWLMPNSVSDTYPLDFNRRLYHAAFQHLNVIPIGNSHYTINTLGDGRFSKHVAHLGVDPAEFPIGQIDDSLRNELGIPASSILLGVFARLVEEKGQLRLIEALSSVRDSARDVHVMLCGGPLDSRYSEHLRERISHFGLSSQVHLLGPIERLQPYYAACDVVVNARLDPEPFGLSIIEGMLMAKPVFAHAAGGPAETIIDGETGWLIPDSSGESFREGLLRMIGDRTRWRAMGQAARDRALRLYTSDAMVERLLEIIDDPAPHFAVAANRA